MDANSKKVKCIYFPGEDKGEIRVGCVYDTMIYVSDYLGTYSINWVECHKNGKVAAQYNAQYLLGMEFVEDES